VENRYCKRSPAKLSCVTDEIAFARQNRETPEVNLPFSGYLVAFSNKRLLLQENGHSLDEAEGGAYQCTSPELSIRTLNMLLDFPSILKKDTHHLNKLFCVFAL